MALVGRMEKFNRFYIKKEYTGSGPESCKLTFDKSTTKKIFQKNGIETPLFEIVSKNTHVDLENLKLKYPLIVKAI